MLLVMSVPAFGLTLTLLLLARMRAEAQPVTA
jgi:hypothetical protein